MTTRVGHREAPFSPKLSNTGDGDSSSALLQCSPVVRFTLHIHFREKGIVNVIERDGSDLDP